MKRVAHCLTLKVFHLGTAIGLVLEMELELPPENVTVLRGYGRGRGRLAVAEGLQGGLAQGAVHGIGASPEEAPAIARLEAKAGRMRGPPILAFRHNIKNMSTPSPELSEKSPRPEFGPRLQSVTALQLWFRLSKTRLALAGLRAKSCVFLLRVQL